MHIIIFNEELSSEIFKLHMQLDLLVVLSVMHWHCIPIFNVLRVCQSDLQILFKGNFHLASLQGSGGVVLVVLGIRVPSSQTGNSIYSSFTLFLSKLIA